MGAPVLIKRLVDTFHRNIESLKSGDYKETQVRREVIDPFFTALGWDVENESGYAEAYKDVIHEYTQKTADTVEAPDYCFRIGGTRKFFVEAKKPGVRIEYDKHPAFQLRRYGWSAKLPLSILTDFEELAVYDCRIPPKKNDKASTARVQFITYEEYIDKWDEIEEIFSREAVLKGSFDKYAESTKRKKGTAEVDEKFLKEMEEWRKLIARNIAIRNTKLNIRELNFTVQKTIDRLIFLRICEDRGIEEYGQLMNLLNGTRVYARLNQIFTRADEKYNSGLFHFEYEKGREEPPDELTPHLKVDDKILKEIIKNLYYPDSPYEFSVLSADILGQVYEQFLGKVIRLTKAHNAVIDDKPEVKKAGGVYYTPTYIVDYIVKNTVGKKLEKKTPRQVAKIKILDPACGSGSFLLGAYQYLLDWHLNYYNKHINEKGIKPGNKKSPVYEAPNGEIKLTTAERKRILLNNIYGVDIDPQAVEVTKLSLLLKVLEGESEETLISQMKMFRERALPDLSGNIKCGNSLISPDFYEQTEMQFLDDEEKLRINVFDWNTEFKEIMDVGGFDVVIGNPPYLRIQGLQEYFDNQIIYHQAKYKSAVKRFDLYLLFIERGFSLLTKDGLLGFICPHKFVNSDFGSGLRDYLISENAINSIISFGNNLIFSQASTYTCLLILHRNHKRRFKYYELPKTENIELPKKLFGLEVKDFADYELQKMDSSPWILTTGKISIVLNKMMKQTQTIGDVFDKVFQGIVTGADEIYFLKKVFPDNKKSLIEVYSEREKRNVLLERNILKPILKGEDVKRYEQSKFQYYCIYPYKLIGDKTVILQEKEFEQEYPYCYNYLKNYKNELRELRIKYKCALPI
jgi:type I restriction-modification system DNA methylase subunit